MAIYMNYNDIEGSVTEEKHTSWIMCLSFQWCVSRDITDPTPGRAADREADSPDVSEITLTKPTDLASPLLLEEALSGEGVDVTIDFCKTEKPFEAYITYILENTMISRMAVSSGGDRPVEAVTLNFTTITYSNKSQNSKGETVNSAKVGYDVSKGAMM